jgi:hypothetical protein
MGEYMLRPGSDPPQPGQSEAAAAGLRVEATAKIIKGREIEFLILLIIFFLIGDGCSAGTKATG